MFCSSLPSNMIGVFVVRDFEEGSDLKRRKKIEFIQPIRARLFDLSGAHTRSCTVESISDRTVEIAIDNGPEVIDLLTDNREFFLLFSPGDPPVYRHCETIQVFENKLRARLTGRPFTGFDLPEASSREKINETPMRPPPSTGTSLSRREPRKGSLGATVWRRRKGHS